MSKNGANALRVRLTAHSTTISNVVLLGYHSLSDGAKLTYMVLESYDWPDENGYSKGKCWPTIESLATARGKSYDTVARHLKELEAAGLIRIESGQERGVPNCYWLLEPSAQENELYITKYSKKPSTLKLVPPQSAEELPPQECLTLSGTATVGGAVNLPDKEPELSQESKPKKPQIKPDSNPLRERVSGKGVAQSSPNRSDQSVYLSRLMDDFSRSLNDTDHAASNRTQAHNLFSQSGLDEPTFTKVLYEAKKRTQWAALADSSTARSGPNRAAYFFQVVRDLLRQPSATS